MDIGGEDKDCKYYAFFYGLGGDNLKISLHLVTILCSFGDGQVGKTIFIGFYQVWRVK